MDGDSNDPNAVPPMPPPKMMASVGAIPPLPRTAPIPPPAAVPSSGLPPVSTRAGAGEESSGKFKKLFGPLVVVGVLLAKFKGLLIPALKFFPVLLKTGGTMFLSIGIYAMQWGWWFALGFVLLLFVHECGHLLAARRVGLKVGAPVFIPFLGAFIALKEAPRDAWIEAKVGIGGPLLGTAGASVCHVLYAVLGEPLFAALAYTGFFLNLFNLAPVGFLDGGRIVTVLSPWLWVVGMVIVVAMLFSHFNFILLLIAVTALPRLFSLFRKRTAEEARYFEVTPAQRLTMAALYFGLAAFLVLSMHLTHIRV